MEAITVHVSGVVLPVLLCVLVGYGMAILALPFDHKVVGALVADVGYPTLILSHLTKQHIALGAFLQMMWAALAAIVCFGLIGGGLFTGSPAPQKWRLLSTIPRRVIRTRRFVQ